MDRRDVRPQIWLQALAKVSLPISVRALVSFFIWDEEEIIMMEGHLSQMTGYSISYISENIAWMIDNGLLVRTQKAFKNRYGSRPARYMRALPSSLTVPKKLERKKVSSSLSGDRKLEVRSSTPPVELGSSSLTPHEPKRSSTYKRDSKDKKSYAARGGKPLAESQPELSFEESLSLLGISERSEPHEIVADSYKVYHSNKSDKYRWAGRSKPRPGEKTVLLSIRELGTRDVQNVPIEMLEKLDAA